MSVLTTSFEVFADLHLLLPTSTHSISILHIKVISGLLLCASCQTRFLDSLPLELFLTSLNVLIPYYILLPTPYIHTSICILGIQTLTSCLFDAQHLAPNTNLG